MQISGGQVTGPDQICSYSSCCSCCYLHSRRSKCFVSWGASPAKLRSSGHLADQWPLLVASRPGNHFGSTKSASHGFLVENWKRLKPGLSRPPPGHNGCPEDQWPHQDPQALVQCLQPRSMFRGNQGGHPTNSPWNSTVTPLLELGATNSGNLYELRLAQLSPELNFPMCHTSTFHGTVHPEAAANPPRVARCRRPEPNHATVLSSQQVVSS